MLLLLLLLLFSEHVSNLTSRLLVGVSSLGLFALVFAVIVALVYGGIHWGLSWDNAVLHPQSFTAILSNIGIIINAFGFLLCLFPLYVGCEFFVSVNAKVNVIIIISLISLISLLLKEKNSY